MSKPQLESKTSMQDSRPLILVDGSSFLFRAYYAMPNLTNSKGVPTGAVYGVVNMLRRLLLNFNPKLMAVVFDAKGKSFRNDIYPEYKAHRPPMPDELRQQIEPIHRIVKAMGLPLLVIDGVEADDVMGTLAVAASKRKMETLLVTSDKDMAQLVNEHVSLYDTKNEQKLGIDGVKEKYGVLPSQIIDYLALMGDSADNIPGIPKVGPKTAVKWLEQYGSMDQVVKHADEIGGKVGENLRASLDLLPLSYQLATIKCDVALETPVQKLTIGENDQDSLIDLFSELEFKTWLKELLSAEKSATAKGGATEKSAAKNSQQATHTSAAATSAIDRSSYQTITAKKELNSWISQLKKADYFAFDLETTSLDYMQANIVGLSFCTAPGDAAYVPLQHDYEGAPKQLDLHETLNSLKPLLENSKYKKLGQNLKYDMSVLARYDIHLQGIAYDTMLESYVLDSTGTRHDMDSLALKYLQHNTIHFEDIAGSGKAQKTFNQIEVQQASEYAAEDADVTLRLHQTLWPKLHAEPELESVFDDIEMPLLPVLSRIERNGVLIDKTMLNKQSKRLAKSMVELEQQAYELAGEEFNLSSPKQIQTILYDKLKLPVLKKTPKKQPSTAEAVLQELALDFALPKVIMEHRGLSKLKSTYTDKLPLQIDPDSGRVHTSYHQAVASTGRLSSTDPNLQNIPIRTDEGRRIRQAFIAAPGYTIVAADYSQIELRIMAHISQDKSLLQAFAADADIHKATAAEVFGLAPQQVSQEQRRRAKAINFGLIYGMSAFGLARQLGISRGEAQQYVDLYFERYPGVKRFMDETRIHAHESGYVKTVFGRRLYLPDINHSAAQRRQYAERTAINAPMQGTAADIIKKAMIKTDHWISHSKLDVRMIMQVHDELVFEIKASEVEKAKSNIVQCMESVATLDVPLKVDLGVGQNWDEAH